MLPGQVFGMSRVTMIIYVYTPHLGLEKIGIRIYNIRQVGEGKLDRRLAQATFMSMQMEEF